MKYLVCMCFILLGLNSCFLSEKDCFEDYLFTIDFNITPAKDTFHVGDTIWISSTIPEVMLNEENHEMVNVSNIDFPIIFAASQVDTLDLAPAEYYFDYVIEQGELHYEHIATWVNVYLQYEKIDKQQYIRFGIIPKRPAVVKTSFYSLIEELEEIHPTDCIGTTSLHYNVNGGDAEANHYYFIKESDNPWIQVAIDAYEIEGMYAFAVLE